MDVGPGIVFSLASITAGFTLYYFIKAGHTERMAKIERGLLDEDAPNAHRSYLEVKLGMLLIGGGIGLLVAFSLEQSIKAADGVFYPAFLFICGGLSLLISYFLVDRLRKKK